MIEAIIKRKRLSSRQNIEFTSCIARLQILVWEPFSKLILSQKMTILSIIGLEFDRNRRLDTNIVDISFRQIVDATFIYKTSKLSLRPANISHSKKSFFLDLSSTKFTAMLSQSSRLTRSGADVSSFARPGRWSLSVYTYRKPTVISWAGCGDLAIYLAHKYIRTIFFKWNWNMRTFIVKKPLDYCLSIQKDLWHPRMTVK